ncbi:ribosomal protein S5 domain 2-type protein [Gilbertella persicaria]|uniref:ribosomal protein S5 domain 2-type protein n=1 Tax=Gilbertella persicaria TaxID=101096 RepID=UPI002220B5AD|nr:ribosomal protein S5 domain 2-type protein [Gilbertella persicaria]KAI8056519.1 ribosomal protein S5 domain 2-type protein [Gilbertella persicaria]
MNKQEESDNRDLQNEELEAIEAIYPDTFKKDPTSPDAYIYTLNLDEDEVDMKSPRKLVVRFFLPPSYPSQDMPIFEVSSIYCGTKKIDNDMLDAIDTGFQSLYQPNQVVLFEWMSWLREYLEDNVKKPIDHEEEEEGLSKSMSILHVEEQQEESDYHPENDDISDEKEEDKTHDRPTVRSLMGSNVYHTEKPPTIFSSEPLLDRKSTFVAHVAQVHSVHDVKVVVAHLLQNKKIAKATHNILAYRITMPDGKVLQDNDDDGESAAGGRLSHLMQILEVENVVVVVTRWFGGIHLGPDRFKDINNVSRNALETFGFIKSKSNTKGNSKKSNKK